MHSLNSRYELSQEWMKLYGWMKWQLKSTIYYYFMLVKLRFLCAKLYIYFNSIHHQTYLVSTLPSSTTTIIIINHIKCLFKRISTVLFFTSPFNRLTLEPKVLLQFKIVISIKSYRSSFWFAYSKFAVTVIMASSLKAFYSKLNFRHKSLYKQIGYAFFMM